MPTVRYYTDLDLTDDNSVVNLRDPIALQDAVNKRTLVSAVPLSVPGDILYETANGTAVVHSYQGAAINPDGSGYVADRAVGLTPGHTIRVTWDVKSTYWTPRAQYLRAYGTGGASHLLQVQAANVDHDGTNFDSFSYDITLPSNATEVLLVAGNNNGYSTVWYQNIVYTDLNVVTGARLPIGDAPAVLQVAAGMPAWVVPTGMIEIGFDGGSVPPASGVKADFVIPFPLRITGWQVIADQAGSMVLDLWRDTYANFPPTVADTVTGSDKPRLSSEVKASSSALTGWSKDWAAGDIVRANLDSASTLKRATVILSYVRI